MSKIALLVPREEMLHQAHNILQDKKFSIQEMRVIRTENAVMEARRSIADGASIIIARGLQASFIKQYTDIPVVEIVLTAQEMALLVMRARQIADRPRPVIAVVGFKNMFCDMSFFDELYGIELRTYYARRGDELPEVAQQAAEDGVDVIIGGDTAVSIAAKAGIPSLFLSMTEDSMRQAFSMAERMEYAMSVEKKTAAQIETLLDYSFSGVLSLDGEGVVAAANPVMEDITGLRQEELKGQNVRKIMPVIGEDVLSKVFREGKDCSLFLDWKQIPVYAVIAPVMIEGRVDGAVITCHKMRKKVSVSGENDGKSGSASKEGARALPALMRFEDILQHSAAMQECVRLARLFAVSGRPVVLCGETGTEKRMLAESIHSSSERGRGPFLAVSCEGISGEEQRNMIFGENGAVLAAEGGTLFLQHLEELTAANQYRLCQLIRFRILENGDLGRIRKADLRVMAAVEQPLSTLVGAGKISRDLYYLLSGLELMIPPFRERKEDLQQKLKDTLKVCCDRYSRYHVLTNGATAVLLHYPWPGNSFQIESFFERLILTAGRRSIDEIMVKELLKELYPELPEEPDEENAGERRQSRLHGENDYDRNDSASDNPYDLAKDDADRIAETLKKYGGSREKTAQELGISKATLWRRMKKYGIIWNGNQQKM